MPLLPPTWIIGGAAGAGLAPTIVPPILGLFGFGAAGPVAGKHTVHLRFIQSGIGNVVAGSLFALAQSIAMGGSLGTGVTFFGGIVGSTLGWFAGCSILITRVVPY
ncbi:hypothetical protein ARMGADRAFT_1025176 [Armillaria gallica]|uniref:Uncharacterized protein n=1 Tax=Armillaria gallica TaxID=47427 RepID=A0A2H3ENM8_ARMGA|nr:hypothetical protein ARMGADRAFT_1025176 [Armillaria gallica]